MDLYIGRAGYRVQWHANILPTEAKKTGLGCLHFCHPGIQLVGQMPTQTGRRGPAHPSHARQDLPGFPPTLLSLPSFGQGLQKIGARYLIKHCGHRGDREVSTKLKKVWDGLSSRKLETIQLEVI